MHDPDEGVAPDGTIVTGAAREHVPAAFEPVLAAATEAVGGAALYLYGSVATGQARIGASDVDLLTVGLTPPAAGEVGRALSRRFRGLCRGVEIGAARPEGFLGDADERYGNRVFLRHYCVPLSGPAPDLPTYPADVRAARGFNGDVAAHAEQWRRDLHTEADPAPLARRVARKTLLALASLVSVHDATWTTDRARAVRRWSEVEPGLAGDLAVLLRWSELDGAAGAPSRKGVQHMVEGTVAGLVEAFAARVGLWSPH